MRGALAYEPVVDERENYELINGEVYMMSRPSVKHWRISNNIIRKFEKYLRGKTCEAFGEVDVHLSADTNVVPDAMIVCNPDIVEDDGIHGVPDLIVEILSPSTARKDRMVKFRLYERCGVKEYWIVNPRERSVEVYLSIDEHFELDGVYQFFTEAEYKRLTDREKSEAEAQQKIKVSLYDDFIVDVKDVFEDVD